MHRRLARTVGGCIWRQQQSSWRRGRGVLQRRRLSTTLPPAETAPATAQPAGSAAEAKPGKWERRLKIAAYVLGPISIPVFFVAAVVYDWEFRDDVNERFPEIVDFVRKRVGFEESLTRRARNLEKAFILSHPLEVTVWLASGEERSQTVSPLVHLSDLYASMNINRAINRIVDIEFGDISDEAIQDPSVVDMIAPLDQSDIRNVVPDILRNKLLPSLWDPYNRIDVKEAENVQVKRSVVEALYDELRSVDEQLQRLKAELKNSHSFRAVDAIEAEQRYYKYRRRQIAAKLRSRGRFWVI